MKNTRFCGFVVIYLFLLSLQVQGQTSSCGVQTIKEVPFVDTFEDNRNNWPQFYTKVKNGRYIIETILSDIPQEATQPIHIDSSKDFSVAAFFSIEWNRKRDFMGITWGGNNTENAFYFGINKERNFTIFKKENGQEKVIKEVSSSLAIGFLYNFNVLEIRKISDKYRFYINKELVHIANFEPFYGNKTGFFIGKASEMRVVRFRVNYLNLDEDIEESNYSDLSYGSKVEYYDKSLREFTSPENASYFRVFEEDSQGYLTGSSKIFRKDSTLYIHQEYENGRPHGTYSEYYSNQSPAIQGEFAEGYKTGLWQYWYENGLKKEELQFEAPKDAQDKYQESNCKIVNFWKPNGEQPVKNGNGFYSNGLEKGFFKEHYFREEGILFNGNKTDVWKGYLENGDLYFEEEYTLGKFIKGVSFDQAKNRYEYTVIEKAAAPDGGFEAFYKFIGQIIEYPKSARRRGIEGRVFINFVVDQNGALEEVKLLKGIHPECDEQALNAVRQSPAWIPAVQRGRKVKMRMSVPIMFKLN